MRRLVLLVMAMTTVGLGAANALARDDHHGGQRPRAMCAGRVATIVGTPGDDHIKGTSHGDVIFAGGGNDTVDGGGGNDIICGGRGNDHLRGGSGKDEIFGGDGNDVISGGQRTTMSSPEAAETTR